MNLMVTPAVDYIQKCEKKESIQSDYIHNVHFENTQLIRLEPLT